MSEEPQSSAPKKPIFMIIREKKKAKAYSHHLHPYSCSERRITSVSADEVESSVDSRPKSVQKYNRKEKSLGELSRKIVTKYGKLERCEVCIDKLASELGKLAFGRPA